MGGRKRRKSPTQGGGGEPKSSTVGLTGLLKIAQKQSTHDLNKRASIGSGSRSLAELEEMAFSNPDLAERLISAYHNSENIRDMQANRQMRVVAALCVFIFMIVWSILLWLLIIIIGFKNDFNYSAQVLVTLIGGTSVSVIGLTGFVIKGLFSGSKADAAEKKK